MDNPYRTFNAVCLAIIYSDRENYINRQSKKLKTTLKLACSDDCLLAKKIERLTLDMDRDAVDCRSDARFYIENHFETKRK